LQPGVCGNVQSALDAGEPASRLGEPEVSADEADLGVAGVN